MSKQTKEEVLAELEWVKKVRTTIGEADRNDKGEIVDLGPDPFEYPDYVIRDIIQNVMTQSVMLPDVKYSIEGTEDESTAYRRVILTLAVSDKTIKDGEFTDELEEAIAEAIAVACDEVLPYGNGEATPIGLFPKTILPDGSIDLKIGPHVKTISSEKGANNNLTHNDILAMLDALTKIVGEEEVKKAKWYMNSNTGLNLATIRKDLDLPTMADLDMADGKILKKDVDARKAAKEEAEKDGGEYKEPIHKLIVDGQEVDITSELRRRIESNYLIDVTDEALMTVGVPDTMLGLTIVYNEYMDDLDKTNSIPIILGILDNSFEMVIKKPFHIKKIVPVEKHDGESDSIYLTRFNVITRALYKDDGSLQPYIGLVIK